MDLDSSLTRTLNKQKQEQEYNANLRQNVVVCFGDACHAWKNGEEHWCLWLDCKKITKLCCSFNVFKITAQGPLTDTLYTGMKSEHKLSAGHLGDAWKTATCLVCPLVTRLPSFILWSISWWELTYESLWPFKKHLVFSQNKVWRETLNFNNNQ